MADLFSQYYLPNDNTGSPTLLFGNPGLQMDKTFTYGHNPGPEI